MFKVSIKPESPPRYAANDPEKSMEPKIMAEIWLRSGKDHGRDQPDVPNILLLHDHQASTGEDSLCLQVRNKTNKHHHLPMF